MHFFKWVEGRQGSGYDKMPLFISRWLKCDFYLLKFPKGVSVPTHTDPVEKHYTHHRINLTLNGPYYVGSRMYVLGPCKRFWRFVYLRPDKYEHGLSAVSEDTYMLSFGWKRKNEYSPASA